MLESGHRLRLNAESGEVIGPGLAAAADHLQGNETVQATMTCLIDNTHSPMTNLFHDFVARAFEFLQDINITKEMILINSFRYLTLIIVRDVGRRVLATDPARLLGEEFSKSPLKGLSPRVPRAG